MEIYLDANATTAVLPQALEAAIEAMESAFGNPSSAHQPGRVARALMDAVRVRARKVLGTPTGELLFMSSATEGIQTAVLSALTALRARSERRLAAPELLLYGATEHKAVPHALKHWNEILRLNLPILPIPVGRDGRHDLDWLHRHAARAGLVCTMAVNNETGVISDLDGIQMALARSDTYWLVDGAQALGKVRMRLDERPINYAAFSGHKLYAPKGIGMLYVSDGAPLTPLIAGAGQESFMRAGTENMPGIAALGAVFDRFEEGELFKAHGSLQASRAALMLALRDAFPEIQFNSDPSLCIPTTINFSVPCFTAKALLSLFEAACLRVSQGATYGAAKSSHVLEAMGLQPWRCTSAIRISFGPATSPSEIREACERIRAIGAQHRDLQAMVSASGR